MKLVESECVTRQTEKVYASETKRGTRINELAVEVIELERLTKNLDAGS